MSPEEQLDQIVQRRPLSAKNLRKLWARSVMTKRLMIRNGWVSAEQWEAEEAAMVRDIENKMREDIRKELGLDEEEK